jgi:hypothetical protein
VAEGQRKLETQYAFTLRVALATPIDLGEQHGMYRRLVPITGGAVEGPRLTGAVLPGGGDWQTATADGTTFVLAHYTLEASDGTPILVTNRGIRSGAPSVLAQLLDGKSVDPTLYYFRTTPRFEAPDGPHGWLTRNMFVATAQRLTSQAIVDVHLVL